jgi:tRNA dimethylallyltransferase
MQVYRGLPILTNQSRPGSSGTPASTRRARSPTTGAWPTRRWTRSRAAGRTPIVVGGTGLYLRAALAELELPPPPAPGARERLEGLYDELGPEAAHELLAERDPAAAAAVHANDRRRVVRALDLAEAGSSLRPGEDRLWSGETRHPTLVVGLDVPSDELARRIEERTESDVRARRGGRGVRRALAEPDPPTAAHDSRPERYRRAPAGRAVESIVRTRRYAAYQRKWMRRIPELVPVDGNRPPAEVAQEIVTLLGSVAG